MDLNTQVSYEGGTDLTWLRSDHGISSGLVRMLDISKFTSGVHYDANTKVLKSGIALAKITASGLYGPYDTTASDGRQTTLDSFLLYEQGLLLENGSTSTQISAPAIRHAIIVPANLPVPAQRAGGASDVTTAATGGQFVFES